MEPPSMPASGSRGEEMYLANPAPSEERKRARIRLSCALCRHKKLKCDRGHPCENCAKRDQSHLCQYPSTPGRNRPAQSRQSRPSDIPSRIRHLEDLVLSLKQSIDRTSTESTKNDDLEVLGKLSSIKDDLEVDDTDADADLGLDAAEIDQSLGRMLVDQKGTRWVDGAHWQAILDDITELKGYLQAPQGPDDLTDTGSKENYDPVLFVGMSPLATKPSLIASLPPRPIVDRLISRFFNAQETVPMTLHVPTFQKEYSQFWDRPEEVSATWLALLFAMLTLSVSLYHRAGEVLPGALGEPRELSDAFRTRAAQSLVLANYTRPGRYKVEALLAYFATEFIRSSDAQLGVSVLLGVTVRLAMHMGYHRDSKHYQNLSVYDGEMRRRVWAQISQIDHLVSFQTGLPRAITDLQCDAELPHNLFDEDFDEATKVLLPSRPETERTPVTYHIVKGRLMNIFGQIAEKTYWMRNVVYEEVMRLDRRLEDVHATLPPFLRIRTMNLSVTDSPGLIMQRYNLELLYQKSRCVLHRKYLTHRRSDLRYTYSRWACVHAAKQILRHQSDIYNETLPGGQLYRDRWFISSLTSHDFILAAMILCLELSREAADEPQRSPSQAIDTVLETREELLQSLETSYRIWMAFRELSGEAYKASVALMLMLDKANRNRQNHPQAEAEPPNSHTETWPDYSVPNDLQQMLVPASTYVEQHLSPMDNQNTIGDVTLGSMEDMIIDTDEFDWLVWDNQIQHSAEFSTGLQPQHP